MTQPRVLILRAPGTNCDLETAYAFELAGARCERRHINQVLESPAGLADFQILCLPGGFSYGDDLAAGRILGSQLKRRLGDAMRAFKDAGKLILGICNGFQILLKSGLLVADEPGAGAPLSLTWNSSGRFEARWVTLRVTSPRAVFFSGIERLYLPIAHAEGRIAARDGAYVSALERDGRIALRYAAPDGSTLSGGELLPFPFNPNGAIDNIAALCDDSGRVCGLMPHPERHIDPLQHPHWTRRRTQPPAGDGMAVFHNAVQYFQGGTPRA